MSMIHAYNRLYLNDAQTLLANAFDYAINDCGQDSDWFMELFLQSSLSKQFENGNPSILSGKSGVEVAQEVLRQANPEESLKERSFSLERSPEYWAGWAIAFYQWITAKRFEDIFSKAPLSQIISMYRVFHEMDITRFVEAMNEKCDSIILQPKLKRIRESRGVSQQELANLSGVKLRSIQLYEQRVNDIDKAQAQTLYKLSRVLGCEIEDLLENPERTE